MNHDCIILEHHAGSMGWSVDFKIDETKLKLEYDRGSLIVIKDPSGENKTLAPTGKEWTKITMKDLAKEVDEEFV